MDVYKFGELEDNTKQDNPLFTQQAALPLHYTCHVGTTWRMSCSMRDGHRAQGVGNQLLLFDFVTDKVTIYTTRERKASRTRAH
jgi:hypothetical protein